MRIIQNLLSIGTLLVTLTACGADTEKASQTSKGNDDTNQGRFEVLVGDLLKFDHNGKRAKSFDYEHDYWEFKADGATLRMAGRLPENSPGVEQTSIDLEYNNVYLEFTYQNDGKRSRISCKPAQRPAGQIKRTVNSDLSSSGTFNIEFVLCRNTYTETTAEIATPVTVKGQFENVPNKESLF